MDKYSNKIDAQYFSKTETYDSHALERSILQQWKPI